MKMHTATRTRITIDMSLDFAPTGSTRASRIDATWHPCSWQGAPTNKAGRWTATALTDGWFAGPGHPDPAGAVVLQVGRHFTETRVTTASGDITARSETVDVVT